MKKIIMFIVIFFSFSFPVFAFGVDNLNINEGNGGDNLYKYIDEMKTEYEILDQMNFKSFVKAYINKEEGYNLKNLSKGVLIYINKEVVGSAKDLALLIVICILFSLLSLLENSFNNENVTRVAYYLCYLIIIIFLFKMFLSCSTLATDTIKKASDFMIVLIPVMLSILASAGSVTQAAFLDPVIIGGVNIFTLVFIRFIIPLCMISFSMHFVDGISEDFSLSNLNKLINEVIIFSIVGMMTAFIGTLTIKGISSRTLDVVTAKTVKLAVDSFIPIVGSCLSDAVTTVASYSLVLKSTIGLVGTIVIIVVTIFPIIKLTIITLMFKLTAALIEPIGDKKIVEFISKTSDALVILLASLISVSVMFFILISMVSAAGKGIVG